MTDLEKQSERQAVAIPDYAPGKQSWEDLVNESSQILGFDLAKEELLDDLVGIPFIIMRVTFTKGIMRVGSPWIPAKVSCECVTAPKYDIRKVNIARRASDLPDTELDSLVWQPDSTPVFNDGSTGIYRQIVERLEFDGRIGLPEGERNGPGGSSVLDLPPSQWTIVEPDEFWLDNDGFMRYRGNVRIFCPRGLRLSKYENEYSPDGTKTRYLA